LTLAMCGTYKKVKLQMQEDNVKRREPEGGTNS